MNEAQLQLQNALTTTFLANLAFLSEYDNELYHKVDELSRMIENGTYIEKYALDFIQENGEFDIYDLINNRYLYNGNPKKINSELIKKTQFDEKNSIFTLENLFAQKNVTNEIDENKKFNIETLSQSNQLSKQDIFSYTNILKDFLENKKKRLKKIEKFVFIGTLLGRHIPQIAEKIDAEIYLVCERNLEIFRLSLFIVDYTILARKSGVIFSVMDDSITEEKKIFKFLSINPLENYLIKFSTTGINISEYIDKLLSIFMSIKPTSYDYNRYLYTYVNRVTNVFNKYNILLLNEIKKNFDGLNSMPVLFLAAGPSLDENIEWIKENQNKFFIVTIGAAYKKLLTNNIRIDVIITLDEQFDILNQLQFDDESISKIDKNTIILASVITDTKILDKFNSKRLFLYEVFVPFYKENIALSGFSVGELSIALLLNMNVKELYLIGLDFALNQLTGSSHSENSASGAMNFSLNNNEQRSEFGLRNGTIKIKGNFNDEVYTTALFYTSIKYLENFLVEKESDVNIYNLSSHGAYFENTIPKKINEINIESFEKINLERINIVELIRNFAFLTPSMESVDKINDEIKFLKEFLKNNLDVFRNNPIKNYQEFFQQAITFISLITDYEYSNSSISQILRNYAQMIFPYLSYHFNDIKIKNESKKVIKIQDNFVKQIEILIKNYILFLERLNK